MAILERRSARALGALLLSAALASCGGTSTPDGGDDAPLADALDAQPDAADVSAMDAVDAVAPDAQDVARTDAQPDAVDVVVPDAADVLAPIDVVTPADVPGTDAADATGLADTATVDARDGGATDAVDVATSTDVLVADAADVVAAEDTSMSVDAGTDVLADVVVDVATDLGVDVPLDVPVDVPTDVAPTVDVPVDVPTDTPTDSGPAFTALEPCNAPGDYVAVGTSIAFTFFQYTPRCLRVRAGTAVTWDGDFGSHPLAPSSTRGTTPNPIPSVTTGTTRSVTFSQPGFYPYYCAFHGDTSGLGMAGVVQVTP